MVKAVLSEGRTDLATIPGGTTSQPQPLDVSVNMNKPFKNGLRKYYTGWLTLQDHQPTPTRRIKHASLGQVVSCIATAWDDIPAELIVLAFS